GANLTLSLRKIYMDAITWIFLGILLAVAVVLFISSKYTDMLRERPAVDGVRQPYNLGRTQMAWWFFLIVISYSFIWLVTGDSDTITPSLLGLMGISSATALAAEMIPSSDESDPRPSKGFWRDLVSDARGVVALDRLQIVVWTLVLSCVFFSSVIWELTMPE